MDIKNNKVNSRGVPSRFFLYLADFDEPLLKPVHAQGMVCHRSADAVFAEAGGLDAQLPQQGDDGRRHAAVPFEFDDHDVVHGGRGLRFVIEELNIEVNGEPFGLALVDQRDTVETVAHGGREIFKGKSGALFEKLLPRPLADDRIE